MAMLEQLIAKGYHAEEGSDRDIDIIDSKGNKTRLVFDENFTAKKIIKPSGLEYGFDFDNDDHINKISFPGNELLEFAYQKNLLKSISLNNERITLNYDDKNRISEIVSPDLKKNKVAYNLNEQLESLTNRANEIKKFETNFKDNRLIYSSQDSLGRTTVIETDPSGSADIITFPDGIQESTVYDEDHDAFLTILRNGAKKLTYYDGVNPSRVEWQDGNYLDLQLNDQQQVQSIENPSGTVSYEYNDKEQIISEDFQENKVSYTYDEDGLLTEMLYPSGLSVKYVYDEDSRLKEINAGGENICTYDYGANDTVAQITYPNGLIETRQQLVLGGLKEASISTDAGELLSRQTYQYDNLSRLTNYRSTDKSNPQKEKEWQLTYDDESRLLQNLEIKSGKTETFEYDKKGNFNAISNTEVRVGKMDEILSFGRRDIEYDLNGNVISFLNTSGELVELKFNDNNELKFAKINNKNWEYWYDGLGRRVGKSDGKVTYKYFWGSDRLLSEEIKTNIEVTLREYIYGESSTVPIAFIENGKTYWLHADARGAVTKVFNGNGQTIWGADYTSFGDANIYLNTIRQPFRLQGQYHDEETDLHYNTARYYSPNLKSFVSLDPQWLQQGATNYSYALNDPYNKIDIDGNLADWVAAGIGLATSIAVGAAVVAFAPAAAAGAAGILALMAIGAIAGALGDGIASIVENKAKGEDICVPCALKAAGMGALFGAVGGPIGKLLGKGLGAFGRKIMPKKMIPKDIGLGSSKGYWGTIKDGPARIKFRGDHQVLDVDLMKDPKYLKLYREGKNPWADPSFRKHFWDNHNKPFLDEQIKKGGKFKIYDDPKDPSLLYQNGNIKEGRTFFGREMNYLEKKGYTIDYETGYLIPPPQ
jgi:RHS repeat-associated protein